MDNLHGNDWIKPLGLIASVVLPLFNIPLMIRMFRRKSSEDLSLIWVTGVFLCIVGTMPAALTSPDIVFKVYQIINVIFFSGVVFLAFYYRKKAAPRPGDRSPPAPGSTPR